MLQFFKVYKQPSLASSSIPIGFLHVTLNAFSPVTPLVYDYQNMTPTEQERWLTGNLLHILNLAAIDFFLIETQENRRLFDRLGFLNGLQLYSSPDFLAFMNWRAREWRSHIYYYFDLQGSLVMRSKTEVSKKKTRLYGCVCPTERLHISDEVYF